MKTIGLVGGTTPEATVEYYRALIALARTVATNTLDNPVIIIYSVNLSEIVSRQRAGRTDEVVDLFAAAFERLCLAGAEAAALTANTPHIYLDRLRARTRLPIVSILDATCEKTKALGCRKVLLLGTGKPRASLPGLLHCGGVAGNEGGDQIATLRQQRGCGEPLEESLPVGEPVTDGGLHEVDVLLAECRVLRDHQVVHLEAETDGPSGVGAFDSTRISRCSQPSGSVAVSGPTPCA